MKININYPLSGRAFSLACCINAWHIDNGTTDIVFSNNGSYPHVTLLMGDVSPDCLTELGRRVRALSKLVVTPTLCLAPPYRPIGDSEYVFLAIKPSDSVREVKEKMAAHLEDVFEPSVFGGVDIVPHVTVAFLTKVERYKPFSSTELIELKWTPQNIAVSEAGEHGTCSKILELIDL